MQCLLESADMLDKRAPPTTPSTLQRSRAAAGRLPVLLMLQPESLSAWQAPMTLQISPARLPVLPPRLSVTLFFKVPQATESPPKLAQDLLTVSAIANLDTTKGASSGCPDVPLERPEPFQHASCSWGTVLMTARGHWWQPA